MLIVNVINTLPIEKTEILKTSMSTSGERSIEKNGRRKKLNQNKVCEEGALRGAASLLLTLCPNIASAPSDSRQTASTETSPNHRERLIKY